MWILFFSLDAISIFKTLFKSEQITKIYSYKSTLELYFSWFYL